MTSTSAKEELEKKEENKKMKNKSVKKVKRCLGQGKDEQNKAQNNYNMEDIIAEIRDRDRRKNNLIIFNIEEQNDTDASLRKNKDNEAIVGLLDALSSSSNTHDVKPVRLGKFANDPGFKLILPNKPQEILCAYQNVRGLRTKTHELFCATSQAEFDVVAFSETWLQDDINNSELFPEDYQVYRSDRRLNLTGQSCGGGVLLAYKNTIKCKQYTPSVISDNFPSIDIVCCKCTVGSTIIYIIVMYIPPSLPVNEFELLFDMLEQLEFLYDNKVVIIGDFNIPQYVSNNEDHKCLCNDIRNSSDRLLDLIFSNSINYVIRDNSPLIKEDAHHPALLFRVQVAAESYDNFSTNIKQKSYNFKKANFLELYNSLLNTNWSFLEESQNVDSAVEMLYTKIYEILDQHVPLYKTFKRTFSKWYTPEIIQNIKIKAKHLEKFKKFKCDFHLRKFRNLRSIIKTQIDSAYQKHLREVQDTILSDSRQFWSYVRTKKQKSRIPGIMFYEDRTLDHPQDIVNKFSDFFSSVYVMSTVDSALIDDQDPSVNNLHINFNNITETEILNAIKSLKTKMTSGPDLIPSFLVKDCANVFSKPLYHIFNTAIKCNYFPEAWKRAKVCPIFENDDPALITNYRGITILNNFAKVFEIIVYNRIYPCVESQLAQHQHGFIKKRSTITNLALLTQFVSHNIDKLEQTDVIYTDFSKAFDRIDHTILLWK
ncbi:hypothetical protein NQ318_005490 [Aromia moschata]|uniref:Endonuclease/exonuclease/phosphatase domain-containing protein n=1 Tax=Aromia moschata TaxID=1265417 RepID=A0AAV8XQL2_9CUCU|nr:hypothetical protein NQ318_005490 [Aromia moschata]